jgi:hypothetical protein
MSRWFRFYDDAVNDPKVQRLSGEKFKAWVNLLCLASKNDGRLPPLTDISYTLRLSEDKVSALLNEFCAAGLIDPVEVNGAPMSYEPHNWSGRQFKSDVSTERVKRFRNGQRNVSSPLPKRPQITDTETETESETETDRSASAPAGKVVPMRRYAFEGRTIRLEQADLNRWRETYRDIPDIMAVLQTADDYYSENPPRDGKWFFPVSRWLQKEHDLWGEKIRQANARPDRSF